MNQFLLKTFLVTITYISLISCNQNLPAIVRKPKMSFNLGPCTWVIDRQCPDSDIKFYLFTRNNLQDRQFVYIDETIELSNLSSSNFNPINPTKIIFHGYNSDMFLHPLIEMKDEYLQIGDYNLFFVDYSNLAIAPCYLSAVHNIQHVGVCVGQLIERLLDEGNTNIHLIGFSLGAHVTNYVSQNVGKFVIPRITGLDPAMPLFIFASNDNKLDPSDATFVDVMHTNALMQGKIEQCGHVDFYMNGGVVQPGCTGRNVLACSHHRAADYFAESIRSYKGFWGWQCSSYVNYLFGLCPPTNFLVLAGEHVRPTTTGLYIITTNDQPPYALGRWTDNMKKPSDIDDSIPFKRFHPNIENLDQWGKIDSSFNNIQHFPTPFPQDPNGNNWPYFGFLGPQEIFSNNEHANYEHENNNVIKLKKNNLENSKITKETLKVSLENKNKDNTNTEQNINDREIFLNNYKKNLLFGIQTTNAFNYATIGS